MIPEQHRDLALCSPRLTTVRMVRGATSWVAVIWPIAEIGTSMSGRQLVDQITFSGVD
jgi:hypothetical protein